MIAVVLAACIVTASAQNEVAPVTVSADVRSYPELAAAFSAPGRRVTVAPELTDRIAVVSLHNRPWSEARSVVEKGLDVTFHQVAEGDWRIEESADAANRKIKLYNAFLIESEAHYAGIFNRFRKLSYGQVPADQVRTKAMIDEQIRSTPPKPGTYQGNRLFATTAPWETIAALALLFGTASDDIEDFKVSGPTLYHMMKGGTMKRLVAGDIIDTGDAYFWRNWQDMPEWVRYRALASVRNHETELAKKQDMSPQEKIQKLDFYARGTGITHRLKFDPLRGEIGYEYSVLEDPSNGFEDEINKFTSLIESRVLALKFTGSINLENQADKVNEGRLLSFQLVLSNGGDSYDKTTVRALRLPMDGAFLKRIATSGDISDDAGARNQTTAEILASDALSHRFTLKAGSTSLAQALADFATETGMDVVASVPVVRDRRLNSGSNRPLLAEIAPWLTASNQDTQGQVKAWTVTQDHGVLVMRDEWAFLDEKYTLPLAPVLALGRASFDVGGGSERGIGYDNLVQYARSVTSVQNAEIARLDPAVGLAGAARAVPLINFIEKQPAKFRQTIFDALRSKDGSITIPLRGIALQTKLAFVSDIRRLCESDEDANGEEGSERHTIFHPWLNDFVPNGSLVISASDMNLPNRKMYRLTFRLQGEPRLRMATVRSKPIQDTPPHIFYYTTGPIELPG